MRLGGSLRHVLLASTAVALALLAPPASFAADECGSAPSAVCDSGDSGYPNFPTGIVYFPATDLTLVVDGGADIAPTDPGIDGNRIISSGGDVSVQMTGNSSIQTSGDAINALYITNANDVSVSLSGTASLATAGNISNGIHVSNAHGDVRITLGQQSRIDTRRKTPQELYGFKDPTAM